MATDAIANAPPFCKGADVQASPRRLSLPAPVPGNGLSGTDRAAGSTQAQVLRGRAWQQERKIQLVGDGHALILPHAALAQEPDGCG